MPAALVVALGCYNIGRERLSTTNGCCWSAGKNAPDLKILSKQGHWHRSYGPIVCGGDLSTRGGSRPKLVPRRPDAKTHFAERSLRQTPRQLTLLTYAHMFKIKKFSATNCAVKMTIQIYGPYMDSNAFSRLHAST